MFLQRVPNDVQPAGRQIDIERLGLQMEPFGRFEEAEMETGLVDGGAAQKVKRSEEHTSELQSLMRISYAVFCLKKKKTKKQIKKKVTVHKYTQEPRNKEQHN